MKGSRKKERVVKLHLKEGRKGWKEEKKGGKKMTKEGGEKGRKSNKEREGQ